MENTMKAKITFLVTVEYALNPLHYPNDMQTPEGMLAADLIAANEDPHGFVDTDNAVWTITGELVQ